MKLVLFTVPVMDYDPKSGEMASLSMDAVFNCPSYGIYLLSSILKSSGHEVVLADLIAQSTRSIERNLSDIEDCSLVGIGATSLSWATAVDVIKQIRQIREDVPIVLGGIHPTLFDQYILKTFPVQYVIRGEGEIAFPALCSALENGNDLKSVPNLSWRTPDGQIIRNPNAPVIAGEDLGKYPLPDYDILPSNIYRSLSIESSRGCAFNCTFCSTSYRRSWRAMPAEQFVDRLEKVMQYIDKTIVGTIHIVDDEFSIDSRRAAEIARIIKQRGLKPKLVYDCRARDILSDDFIESIEEFTVRFLVGAECGYDEGLKRVGKGITCQDLEDAARKLHQHGLSTRAEFSFIIGLPWETKAEVEKTIAFAVHLHTLYGVNIIAQWYLQMPGSHLWYDFRQRELVNEAMYDYYGFFRDLYLFKSGVQLTPKEIWEIYDKVALLRGLSYLKYNNEYAIKIDMPMPIQERFPRETLFEENTESIGLIGTYPSKQLQQ